MFHSFLVTKEISLGSSMISSRSLALRSHTLSAMTAYFFIFSISMSFSRYMRMYRLRILSAYFRKKDSIEEYVYIRIDYFGGLEFLNKVLVVFYIIEIVTSWVERIDVDIIMPNEIPKTLAKTHFCRDATTLLKMVYYLKIFQTLIVYVLILKTPPEIETRTLCIRITNPPSLPQALFNIGVSTCHDKYLVQKRRRGILMQSKPFFNLFTFISYGSLYFFFHSSRSTMKGYLRNFRLVIQLSPSWSSLALASPSSSPGSSSSSSSSKFSLLLSRILGSLSTLLTAYNLGDIVALTFANRFSWG